MKPVFRILFLILSYCLFTPLNSTAQNWQWVRTAGGLNYDYSQSMVTDAAGNIYETGYFTSATITFGSITLTNSGTNVSMFLVKYNSAGNVVWAKSVVGSSDVNPFAIAVTTSGNIYVTGLFAGASLTFGTTTLGNIGDFSMFLFKYDTSGNAIWARSAIALNGNSGGAIATDVSGNIYVEGAFNGSKIIFGSDTLTNTIAGTNDVFIVKYDLSGNVIWAKSGGGSGVEYPASIATDISGNVFASGLFNSSTATFGSTTLTNAGSFDIFLVKYDVTGNMIWAKGEGDTGNDEVTGITTDASGNIYMTGYFGSPSINFGTTTLTNSGQYNFFLTKYNSSGNVDWAKSAGGSFTDLSSAISIDTSANIYITGYYTSSTLPLGTTILTNSDTNMFEIFVAKYNGSGDVVWANGTSATDFSGNTIYNQPVSIANDNAGNVYVSGYFVGNTITFGDITIPNPTPDTSVVFLAQYSSTSGVPIFTQSQGDINIYPNPVTALLNITDAQTINQIIITDLLGQVVYSKDVNSYNLQVDMSNLSSGLYFIKVNGDQVRKIEKR